MQAEGHAGALAGGQVVRPHMATSSPLQLAQQCLDRSLAGVPGQQCLKALAVRPEGGGKGQAQSFSRAAAAGAERAVELFGCCKIPTLRTQPSCCGRSKHSVTGAMPCCAVLRACCSAACLWQWLHPAYCQHQTPLTAASHPQRTSCLLLPCPLRCSYRLD